MWLPLSTLPRGLVSPGSACLLAAAPQEWIATFPTPNPTTGNIDQNITLITGKNWLRLILASRKRTLRETTNRAAQGTTYPVTINGSTVGTSNYLHHQLYNYSRHRWILLYTESGSNIVYIIGHPDAGAQLNFDYNNSSATQSQLTFSFTGILRAPVYQGSYTLDNNITVAPSNQALQSYFYTATGTETNNTDFTIPLTIGRTPLFVSRAGMTDMQPVSSAPTGDKQIQFFPLTGTFRVNGDYLIAADEQFTILYR